ncbi:MAG: type II toxin-antitoxin system prevent-host-death family antitoxin [Myxococcota bacterium]
MQHVSKSALKARMLEYFRRVEETGEPIIVTDNGRPVLQVSPIKQRRTPEELFGDVRGRVKYFEDVLEPETGAWPET